MIMEMVLPKATHRVRTEQQSQLTPEQVDQILSIREETAHHVVKALELLYWKGVGGPDFYIGRA